MLIIFKFNYKDNRMAPNDLFMVSLLLTLKTSIALIKCFHSEISRCFYWVSPYCGR